MSTYLFLGGPADGTRVPVDEGATWWRVASIPDKTEFVMRETTAHVSESFPIKEHIYERTVIGSREVFVDRESSSEEVINSLIDKYPPPGTFWMGYDLLEKLVNAMFEGPTAKEYLRLARQLSDKLMKHRREKG